LGSDVLLAKALTLRGEQLGALGQYSGALDDLHAAYNMEHKLNNVRHQQYTLNAIANIYGDRYVKDYDNALAAYRTLLAVHEKSGNRLGQANTRFNMAVAYDNQEKYDEALDQLERAVALHRALGDKTAEAYDLRSIGAIQSKRGQHADALATLDRSLALYREAGAKEPSWAMASLHLTRGAAHRRAKRYPQALAELDAARAYFIMQKNMRFLERVHEERALTLAASGDWRAAYQAQGEFMNTRVTLQQQIGDERTARLRVQLQSEQARARNEALARQNALQKSALASGIVVRRWQYAALALSAVLIVLLAGFTWRQMRLGRRMRDLALTDELTRLPNRRHFMALAKDAFARAHSGRTPVALAALDVDHFKRINDTHGHAVGDAVLQRIAHALRTACRPGDTVGRTGGEEFTALLPGATMDAAMAAAQRMRLAVAAIDCSDLAPGLQPSISVGLANGTAQGHSVEAAYRRADKALYKAKANGRNRVELDAELAAA
ncbi:MAG TPA: tetratricopeptide repeat-containing diguanylate cyclase, partial [Burkholderiaceae bacterium]